ncbi:CotO family spore coat protein [Bacillus sp. ISL-39]|uniref:CotO family spore coat protein n=1 Tax=Bacillus sp. ISL-39 TaxID=2819124 RepID=UPI001BEA10BB|nr:CotO family spore coat protein [Bacillus sp. ISL-39]MBT2639243.1 hypothetical protein [Bacillus sp. ISL-39]
MGRKRSRKQTPLFYINQPNIEFPKLDMQKNFIYKTNEADKEPELLDNNKTEDDAEMVEQEEVEEETNESEQVGDKKKKTFQEYTLEEKIKHLNLVPATVAKVKYEFITLERSYKGYFTGMKGRTLLIHSVSPRRKNVNLLVEDIVDIKRIGL